MPKKKKSSRYKKFTPVFRYAQVLAGLLFLLIAIGYLNSSVVNFVEQEKPPISTSKVENLAGNPIETNLFYAKPVKPADMPKRILISKADIDIKVVEAPVVDGYWELSETTASHGIGSTYPGQKGNMVIFAHAREGLFYNLKNVATGDKIYVFTDKNWYQYQIKEIKTVYPDQIEVVAPSKDEILTLFTCSGYSDEKRLIVVATPTK